MWAGCWSEPKTLTAQNSYFPEAIWLEEKGLKQKHITLSARPWMETDDGASAGSDGNAATEAHG